MNLLEGITRTSAGKLVWDHEPVEWRALQGGGLQITAPAQADYFQDPQGKHIRDAAPYLWMPIEGDFVAQAHVRPRFTATYDSGCLMVRHDSTHWAKLCYEATDFGTTAAVSVVTNGISDDANGSDLTVTSIWLQLARVANAFALHYSFDGSKWRMVRCFYMQVPMQLKIGIVAQCPVGNGANIDFLSFGIESRTVADLRAGM